MTTTRNKIFITLAIIIACVFVLPADSCDVGPPKSDEVQQAQQEGMRKEAVAETGMPGISNFTELKFMKMLYELRDTKVATFAYTTDMEGRLHFVCDAIGYGLPYGVQYSNPEKHQRGYNEGYNLPQSEPNGLFMPPTAEGTWVMCAGRGGKIDPIYIEPRVIVSPHKLRAVDSYALAP